MSKKNQISYETTLMVKNCCLCLHMQRAARSIARTFDNELRSLNITNGQFSLLMSLNRPVAPAMKSVAELLAMDRTTLTAALKSLESRGLIKTKRDAKDKRSRLLFLTSAGRKVLAKALPIWVSTHADIEKVLGASESERLRQSLRSFA